MNRFRRRMGIEDQGVRVWWWWNGRLFRNFNRFAFRLAGSAKVLDFPFVNTDFFRDRFLHQVLLGEDSRTTWDRHTPDEPLATAAATAMPSAGASTIAASVGIAPADLLGQSAPHFAGPGQAKIFALAVPASGFDFLRIAHQAADLVSVGASTAVATGLRADVSNSGACQHDRCQYNQCLLSRWHHFSPNLDPLVWVETRVFSRLGPSHMLGPWWPAGDSRTQTENVTSTVLGRTQRKRFPGSMTKCLDQKSTWRRHASMSPEPSVKPPWLATL